MSGLAALALVGSAFAVWHFGESVNKSIDGDYYIEAAYDAGTIDSVDLTWGKAASLNDGAGPHAVATTDKILILDQPDNGEDRDDVHWAYETTDDATQVACKAQYTYGVEDETKRLAVILTYSVDFIDASGNVETDSGLAKYIGITNNSGTWTPNAYITMPTLAYKTGMAPDTIEKYNTMLTDLQGSKVRFKFKATATAHQTPITIDGMTFTLNADGESYSLTSYSAPATPSGLYRGVRRLIVDTLTIPSTVDGAPVTELAEYCLNGAMVKNVIIPNTVVSIGTEAFEDDAYLESVSMPDSVRSIGISAFNGCEKLAAFHVPTSLSTLGALAFENTKALQAFDFDGNASFGISPDKTLILTADGTSIVASAAGALAVSIPSTVTQIPDRVLMSLVSMKTLTIPASVISILVSDNAWTALTDVYYLGTMAQWSNVSKLDGWLLNGSTVSVVHCSDGDTANVETKNLEYVLNEGGTGYAVSIGSADTNAVEQYGLFVPTVHNGLPIAEIPNDAFSSWAMPKAILPNAITKIGDFAFFDCSLGSINIPTSVVSIGISAFWEGSLTSVVFPVSLTSIGQEAFENNTSLASITYQGTKAQWAAVSKGTNWAGGVPSTTVITCTDGTVALS